MPAAIGRGIDLGFESPGQALWIVGDDLLLRELLKNLIDNAFRYCPEGARVTVRMLPEPYPGWATLEVEDDGPGIPETERERVFQRFYRIPGSDSEGSGLGLAIVHEIAEAHDGLVVLHSGASGKGLLVRVDLPSAESVRTS